MLVSGTTVPLGPPHRNDYTRLLSLASHELRTPLSVAAGYVRMLQKDRDQFNERHRKMIDEADKACSRLAALATEISAVGKLESGETPLLRDTVDVTALVREVAAQEDTAAGRRRVEVRDGGKPAHTRGDRGHLKSAFEAFLRAVLREQIDEIPIVAQLDHRPDGTLRIAIAKEAQFAATLERPEAPFDEFRGGIGLVLPTARRIIELHDGRVWSPAGETGAAAVRSGILVVLPLVD